MLNRVFFWGHDPVTHVRRARYLTVVGDPSLSVSVSVSVILVSRNLVSEERSPRLPLVPNSLMQRAFLLSSSCSDLGAGHHVIDHREALRGIAISAERPGDQPRVEQLRRGGPAGRSE